MKNMMKKTAGLALLLGVLALLVASCSKCPFSAGAKKDAASIAFDSADFYDADGKFLKEKGKDAVMALLEYHGFPMFEGLREKIWVTDYNKGDFAKLGLAGVGLGNHKEDNYMVCYLFLLPGQMLAEHYHAKPDYSPKAKMEGWHVAGGLSYIGGVGEDNLAQFPFVKIPQSHAKGRTITKHVFPLKVGEYASLKKEMDYHWQFGGPEGAVIIEAGTFQDGKLNRFSYDTEELK